MPETAEPLITVTKAIDGKLGLARNVLLQWERLEVQIAALKRAKSKRDIRRAAIERCVFVAGATGK